MNRLRSSLPAVAIICTFVLPAATPANASNVQISGVLDISVDSLEAKGATAGQNLSRRNAVTDNLSQLVFRGREDLGDGLAAIWQIGSSVRLDTGGGAIAGRPSFVGLAGSWGKIRLGTINSPFKLSTIDLDPFGDGWSGGVGAYTNILGSGSGPGGNALWDLRLRNTVVYSSPDLNGLSAEVMYSAGEQKTDTIDPRIWSLSVTYLNGPLYLTAAGEWRHDQIPATAAGFSSTGTRSKDTAGRLGASYTIGSTILSGAYERIRYEQDGTAEPDIVRNAYMLGIKHTVGRHILRASYSRGLSVSDFPGTGARQVALGYGYALSKRTEVFGAWARLNNDAAAAYTPTSFDANGLAVPAGADPKMLSIGIHHEF